MAKGIKNTLAALVLIVALASVVWVWNNEADDLNESKDQMRTETVDGLGG